jgi:hypothetical protein
MLEVISAVGETEVNTCAAVEEFVMLADLQLALVGGGSGIAQLD